MLAKITDGIGFMDTSQLSMLGGLQKTTSHSSSDGSVYMWSDLHGSAYHRAHMQTLSWTVASLVPLGSNYAL